MNNGYTITPQVAEGPEGDVLMDFDVQSDAGRQQGIENFQNTEHYYQDEMGNNHHYLEDMDFEIAELAEDDYTPELTGDDFESFLTPEDQSYLMDITGSEQEYQQMTAWLSNNVPEEINQSFNRLLQEGDVEVLEAIITKMYNYYRTNS